MAKLMISLIGTTVQEHEKEILLHPNLAGVVLFSRNYVSKEQLKNLCDELNVINEIRFKKGDLPLIRWCDHEGETVWRFKKDFTVLPTAMHYGQLYDQDPKQALEKAEEDGYQMALELLAFNIYSLAPVVDCHYPESEIIAKYSRAFHSDPKIVAVIGESFIRGMHRAGMPVTLKHYPGHGACIADSHTHIARDTRSKEEIIHDLYPFITLIQRGLVDAIMPAHVIYPAFDENSAGFSKVWLQEKLREEYQFKGCIISDCVTMEGANIGSFLDRVNLASYAGCDIVILCNQTSELLLTVLNTMPTCSRETEERILKLIHWKNAE